MQPYMSQQDNAAGAAARTPLRKQAAHAARRQQSLAAGSPCLLSVGQQQFLAPASYTLACCN